MRAARCDAGGKPLRVEKPYRGRRAGVKGVSLHEAVWEGGQSCSRPASHLAALRGGTRTLRLAWRSIRTPDGREALCPNCRPNDGRLSCGEAPHACGSRGTPLAAFAE
jgi:hypothetical protein